MKKFNLIEVHFMLGNSNICFVSNYDFSVKTIKNEFPENLCPVKESCIKYLVGNGFDVEGVCEDSHRFIVVVNADENGNFKSLKDIN